MYKGFIVLVLEMQRNVTHMVEKNELRPTTRLYVY